VVIRVIGIDRQLHQHQREMHRKSDEQDCRQRYGTRRVWRGQGRYPGLDPRLRLELKNMGHTFSIRELLG
jgi:DNA-binding protein H-NS